MQFKSVLKEESSGDKQRNYMRNAGGIVRRIIGGVKSAVSNLQHTSYIDPRSLNGVEVISSEGKQAFPQTTSDSISCPTLNILKVVNMNLFIGCKILSTIQTS